MENMLSATLSHIKKKRNGNKISKYFLKEVSSDFISVLFFSFGGKSMALR